MRNLNLRGDQKFRGRELKKIFVPKISFFFTFGYFCMASKIKIEVFEGRDQT